MCRSFFYTQNKGKELMRLQEEVENRTVNLVVSTTKLTARSLIRGLRWYLMSRNQKRMRKAMAHEEGKQSVKELLKSGVGTDKIELPDGSAKDFCKLANVYLNLSGLSLTS